MPLIVDVCPNKLTVIVKRLEDLGRCLPCCNILFWLFSFRYKATMLDDVPHIFEAVFQCTLEVTDFMDCVYLTGWKTCVAVVLMPCILYWHLLFILLQMITKNFEDYPEHRLKFFSLLRAIATFCFPALIKLSSPVSDYVFAYIILLRDWKVVWPSF